MSFSLKAPKGEKVILVGHATGVQIYVCQSGANAPFAWALTAPEADLVDASGNKIIHHFAGPTWKHIDGSEVVGKKVVQENAPGRWRSAGRGYVKCLSKRQGIQEPVHGRLLLLCR